MHNMHKTLYVLFPWDSNEKPWSHAINILEQNGTGTHWPHDEYVIESQVQFAH